MSGRGDTLALACAVRGGDYVVDEAAVADAILASGVLVAAKPQHWLTFWVLDDEAPAFLDTA